MEENQDNEAYKIPPHIIVSTIPIEIDCSDIEINEDTSVANAYLIAHKYPSVQIAEGLILIQDTDNALLPVAHVWNKIGDLYLMLQTKKPGMKEKK